MNREIPAWIDGTAQGRALLIRASAMGIVGVHLRPAPPHEAFLRSSTGPLIDASAVFLENFRSSLACAVLVFCLAVRGRPLGSSVRQDS